jgi:hypothetical protein
VTSNGLAGGNSAKRERNLEAHRSSGVRRVEPSTFDSIHDARHGGIAEKGASLRLDALYGARGSDHDVDRRVLARASPVGSRQLPSDSAVAPCGPEPPPRQRRTAEGAAFATFLLLAQTLRARRARRRREP